MLVPFVDSYRPLWTGLGIVGLYLLLAVLISSWLRRAIGYAWWRRLHGLAFGVWALATAHGLGSGSDTGTPWAAALYAGSVLLVGGLTAFRLMEPHGRAARRRPVVAALVAFAMGAGVVWLAGGL